MSAKYFLMRLNAVKHVTHAVGQWSSHDSVSYIYFHPSLRTCPCVFAAFPHTLTLSIKVFPTNVEWEVSMSSAGSQSHLFLSSCPNSSLVSIIQVLLLSGTSARLDISCQTICNICFSFLFVCLFTMLWPKVTSSDSMLDPAHFSVTSDSPSHTACFSQT